MVLPIVLVCAVIMIIAISLEVGSYNGEGIFVLLGFFACIFIIAFAWVWAYEEALTEETLKEEKRLQEFYGLESIEITDRDNDIVFVKNGIRCTGQLVSKSKEMPKAIAKESLLCSGTEDENILEKIPQ